MNELKITLLGPSAVGKTSLLTSMYEQFKRISFQANLQLIPEAESHAILKKRLKELKSLTETFKVQPGAGIPGSSEVRSFIFDLAEQDKKPFLRLNFYDYPGGYISDKASPNERKFVRELMNDAAAVVIAIDTPALMMSKGKFNEYVNKPKQITAMFKEAYQDIREPRLVIFAPVKCEMEMIKGERAAKQLLERIKKEYADLLNFLSSPPLNSQVAIAITPVQTLGCVICTTIEEPRNNYLPTFGFRKISRDAEYNPVDNDQPLRYLLRFLLKMHHEGRTPKFLQAVVSWIGLDAHIKNALTQFSRGCKNTAGFVVLQGRDLL
ncbi:hypothetical protein [Okeania sp. SIO2B3]|uniref:TRAFAC clade GTPase domain-containing protein n=1 Tax=Okeania sp. SIO2B3 TaxID=2607784 RepID=UPI0013C17C6C|nr:hypothetical protein [Okeania sp. SIO2B3]NET42642.1 hypothetical protein [Okeania sp. SIO2B3]